MNKTDLPYFLILVGVMVAWLGTMLALGQYDKRTRNYYVVYSATATNGNAFIAGDIITWKKDVKTFEDLEVIGKVIIDKRGTELKEPRICILNWKKLP